MDLTKLQIVIFDWDNTLAESRTALVRSVNQVLEEYNLPSWDVVSKLRDNNLSFRDNFPRIFGDKAEEAYKKYSEIYKQNVASLITTFDGVIDTLNLFKSRGVKIVIMSNKDRELLEYELPLIFEKNIFDRVVCGREAKRDKPYPEHAYYSLDGLIDNKDISEESVWIVGDSPQDSTCAINAKVKAIRIGKSIWHEQETECSEITYFKDFKEFYQELISNK